MCHLLLWQHFLCKLTFRLVSFVSCQAPATFSHPQQPSGTCQKMVRPHNRSWAATLNDEAPALPNPQSAQFIQSRAFSTPQHFNWDQRKWIRIFFSFWKHSKLTSFWTSFHTVLYDVCASFSGLSLYCSRAFVKGSFRVSSMLPGDYQNGQNERKKKKLEIVPMRGDLWWKLWMCHWNQDEDLC